MIRLWKYIGWAAVCAAAVWMAGNAYAGEATPPEPKTAPILSDGKPDSPPDGVLTPNGQSNGFSGERLPSALKQTGQFRTIQSRWLGPYESSASGFRRAMKLALIVIFPLLSLLGISFLWSRLLQRKVDARTRQLALHIALLKAQSEASIDGILAVDGNAMILWFNRRMAEMWGIPPQPLGQRVDEPVLRFVASQVADPKQFVDRIQYLYAHQDETSREEIILKDGRIFDRYSAPILSGKTYHGRVWYFRDISEHKNDKKQIESALAETRRLLEGAELSRRALLSALDDQKRSEEALRESEQRIRDILHTAMDGYWRVALDGRLLEVNEAYCKMSGYSEPELLTMSVSDLVAAETPADSAAHIKLLCKQRQDRFESRHRRKDGSLFTVEASVQYKKQEGGYMVAFLRDITERLQQAARLQQAQKMESIGRLAGGVAHDFNNLLMGIMGYTELCRDALEHGGSLRPYLDEILNAAKHSAAITRQLLAFARKQRTTPVVLDLNHAISGTLPLLRRLIGENIELAWKPQADPTPVRMDPSQIDQILANLAANARDAIGGVGTLTLTTATVTLDEAFCARHTGAHPGAYVRLTVNDSGCGMDPGTLEHLFEPFFTTKGVGKGTGLGLATVYGIVTQNSGFVDVRSEPDKGTTFEIFLPREEAAVAPAAEAAPVPAVRTGGTETLLLVEDERSIRFTSKVFLTAVGYTVMAAESPDEALCLVAAQAGPIHLLITDVVMPGLSGHDLARQLTQKRPEMRCIFMSGYTADTIGRGIAGFEQNFLHKPVSRDQLLQKVRQVLDRP